MSAQGRECGSRTRSSSRHLTPVFRRLLSSALADLPRPRSNNMTPHIPEEFSTRLIDWSPFVIMGNTMPPRDPDEDEADEDEEDHADEPPLVREPDED